MPFKLADHKRGITIAGLILGGLVVAGIVLFLFIRGLQGEIASQKKTIGDLQKENGACIASKIALQGEIDSQNRTIAEAVDITERMRAQQERARSEARAAREDAAHAIAAMRRENARAQSCEEVRQKLISEATGHEFNP